MITKKVSNRKFVSLLKKSSGEDFKYPEKYNIKTPLVQKCKYCKKKTVSGDLDIDNGIAVYVCKRCGGRNICSPRKIKFPRRIFLLFVFLIFLSFIVVFGSDILAEIKIINEKINDFEERISDSVDDLFDGANDGTLYEGYNTISLNPNGEGVYLFKPTESGYYLFTSESSGDADLDGSITINDIVVCENDDFFDSKNFKMLYNFRENEDVYLRVKSDYVDMSDNYINISHETETFAQAFEMFKDYKESGIYISSYDTIYDTYADFSGNTANFNESGIKTVLDFSVDEYQKILWVSLDANRDGEKIVVWYPVNIE